MTNSVRIIQREDLQIREPVVLAAVRRAFTELAAGRAIQPAQSVTLLPGGGDAIVYQGVLPEEGAYAIKVSPYLPRDGAAPVITAWTLLISTETGVPVALIDSKLLTAERTAATSALAIDTLAAVGATRLAIIGAGPIAKAHARYARLVRPFDSVTVFSRNATSLNPAEFGGEVVAAASARDAVKGADVVLLCTSAAEPVIDLTDVRAGALVTSISTNAPRAHEIDPAALQNLELYCDHRAAAPVSAGEFMIAREAHGFNDTLLRGDLGELLVNIAPRPTGTRIVYFRSIGLGIEDAAVAVAVLDGGGVL